MLALLTGLVGTAVADAAALPQAAAPADIRVLIDVSGSMKKNDPNNLRRSALDLLVRLFPTDATGGIWSFGHTVQVMVPHGHADEEWRANGSAQAQRIHSRALHTDIPAALTAAMSHAATAADRRTSVILLTDGMVDVSKSAEVNAAARQRVIDELAPGLRAADVRVHAIALSAEADHELLQELALVTGGISAVADDAEDLQRIFVEALDAAAPAEQLPISDNRFLVDSSVDELTALVFHSGAPMTLVAPDGARHTGSDHGDDFAWHRGDGYELVTITKPYEGEWRLEGDVESGSRITIVSDLSLAATRLPDNLFPGEPPRVEALLRERGEPLQRPELLALVQFTAELVRFDSDGEPEQRWQWPLTREGEINTALLPILANELGSYELNLVADGKTFKRSLKQRLAVRDHFALETSLTEELPPQRQLVVRALNPALTLATATPTVTVRSGEGEATTVTPESFERGWRVVLPTSDTRRVVIWSVEFALPDTSRQATWHSGAIELDGTSIARGPAQPLALVEPPSSKPEPVPEPAPEPELVGAAVIAEAEPNRPWLLYGGLAMGNLLLIALGVVAYRRIMRTDSPALADDPAADAASDATAQPPASAQNGSTADLDPLDLPLDGIDLDPAADKT